MDCPKLIVSNWKEESISIQMCEFLRLKTQDISIFLPASLALQKYMAIMFGLISWYM